MKIAQIFVCFSESPNFSWEGICIRILDGRTNHYQKSTKEPSAENAQKTALPQTTIHDAQSSGSAGQFQSWPWD